MKKILIWSGAVIGIAGIVALVLMNKNTQNQLKSKIENDPIPVSKTEAYIQPPFPGKEVPFSNYRICVKTGGIINHSTGSIITIPPNAFNAANGQSISDSINIRYREFHNPLEIFLSGIPMKYDSAGVSNTLESAGMIEILATDKNENLILNQQTPVQIKMVSTNNEERFNLYKLDTISKNWVYKGKDKLMDYDRKPVASKKVIIEEETKLNKPIQPVMADPQKYCFKIGYDKKEFPELAAYENVLFEVTDKSFKPSYYKINWNKISLYSTNTEAEYIVKLKKADTTISVTAKPVFDKTDYSNALEKFEEKHKEASKERDQKEYDRLAKLNKINGDINSYSSRNIMVAANNMSTANMYLSYRSFPINSMGIHNCDFPLPPSINQYAFSLKKNIDKLRNSSENISYSTVFLVEKGKNTVFRFSKGEVVKCNPKAKNLMWTLTDKNELAFFRVADYTQLSSWTENNIIPVVAANQEKAFEEIKKFSE